MIDIVLADDHRVVCQGFQMIINAQEDMKVIGTACSAQEAIVKVAELHPDVFVTDISMGGPKTGLLALERLADRANPSAVVILSMHEEQEYLRQAMALGAKGYVLKSSSDESLFNAIRSAARGEIYICQEMLGAFVQDALNGVNPNDTTLTPRESQIVTLAVKGYSNTEIADRLSVSVKTVESQKSKIMNKLKLHSKPELFEYAVAHNLLKM
ncbi:MAG: response regulator transcription factor [Coriobacteriia bacterium]|nr:response regulator transcription factor [Coriobacteriia bacterium]